MGTHTQDVTVVGWVGSDLRTYHLDGVGGVPYAQFRLASTRRVLDRETGLFRDGPTLWFTVKAWRTAAVNLASSLVKGDPVVVVGRLGQSEWVAQDGTARSELVLEALAVGHDLTFGTTAFRRSLAGARRGRGDTGQPAGPGDVASGSPLAPGDVGPAGGVLDGGVLDGGEHPDDALDHAVLAGGLLDELPEDPWAVAADEPAAARADAVPEPATAG